MKYILVVKQNGYGCDYTIGCGYYYHEFDAPDYDWALNYAKGKIWDNYPPGTDKELDWAILSEKVGELPLSSWYNEYRKAEKKAEELDIRDKELAELERLRKKYGQ